MSVVQAILPWTIAVGLVAVAVVTVRDWRRVRTRTTTYLALAVGSLAAVTLVGAALPILPSSVRPAVGLLNLVGFMGSGYAMVLVRDSLAPLRSRTKGIVALLTAAAMVPAVLVTLKAAKPPAPVSFALGVLLIGTWCFLVGEPTIRLWLISTGRPAVQRARLRSLSMGFGLLVVILVIAVLASPAAKNPIYHVGLQVLDLGIVPLLYMAFAPPGWVRQAWRHQEEAQFAGALQELLVFSSDREVVARRTLRWAVRLVGAHGGLVVDAGTVLHAEEVDSATSAELVRAAEAGRRGIVELGRQGAAIIAPWRLEAGNGGIAVTAGPYSPLFGADEYERLQRYAMAVATCLDRVRLVEALRASEESLRELALHDPLTGLANRTLFTDRLGHAILTATRDGRGFGVLLMDMDRFKDINDSLGHHSGDILLEQVSARLRGVMREVDTVARLGGDEFAVLPVGVHDRQGLVITAQKILAACEAPFELGATFVEVSLSIGIAMFGEHGRDVDVLLRHADVAMYHAKRSHSGYALYSLEHDAQTADRLELMGELRDALRHHELVLHYQPQVDFRTGEARSVEALVRWQHPRKGLLGPDEFIPVAEETDLMAPLARYVIGEALRQVDDWRRNGINLNVAVNLSAANLQESTLPDMTADLLNSLRLPPSSLTIEITERAIMVAQADRIVRRLCDMGVGISIDDFGTGYSSLSYLKTLPVTEIKIDQSFIRGMASDPDDVAIVQPTIDLGHNLHLKVVAEGIEDEATWQILAALGCDVAQGWYIGRAMPADQMTEWMRAGEGRVPVSISA